MFIDHNWNWYCRKIFDHRFQRIRHNKKFFFIQNKNGCLIYPETQSNLFSDKLKTDYGEIINFFFILAKMRWSNIGSFRRKDTHEFARENSIV